MQLLKIDSNYLLKQMYAIVRSGNGAKYMKTIIIQFPFGFVAFDDKNKIMDQALLPKKPNTAAKALFEIETEKLTDDLTDMIGRLRVAGFAVFSFETAGVASRVKKKLGVSTEVAPPAEVEFARSRMSTIAKKIGFVREVDDLAFWTRKVSIELAKLKVKGAIEKRDLIVAQAIQTLDDLDRTVNLFMGRLREWYGVHFPELDRLILKHETFARLVMNLGNKNNFLFTALEKEDVPRARAKAIAEVAVSSMGADIAEEDLLQIQALGKDVLKLYSLRKNMENYLDKTMSQVAPNTKALVGALLGARLIAVAGGLRNLAMRPASTIQVLGAEKALFRSLKTGARPPKHGLLFQHKLLHDAKRWQRGKIARALAGKLVIAIRADAFGEGRHIGDALQKDLEKRLAEIREKYKDPPVQEKKPKFEKHQRSKRHRSGKKWRKSRRARKG